MYYYNGTVLNEISSMNQPVFDGGAYAGWERGEYEIDLATYNNYVANLKQFHCSKELVDQLGPNDRKVEIDIDFSVNAHGIAIPLQAIKNDTEPSVIAGCPFDEPNCFNPNK